MNTKFIGVRDFRQKMNEYATKARTQKTRYIVVSHKKPLFEITPFNDEETLDSFYASIIQAKEDVADGKVHTHDEIMKMLS